MSHILEAHRADVKTVYRAMLAGPITPEDRAVISHALGSYQLGKIWLVAHDDGLRERTINDYLPLFDLDARNAFDRLVILDSDKFIVDEVLAKIIDSTLSPLAAPFLRGHYRNRDLEQEHWGPTGRLEDPYFAAIKKTAALLFCALYPNEITRDYTHNLIRQALDMRDHTHSLIRQALDAKRPLPRTSTSPSIYVGFMRESTDEASDIQFLYDKGLVSAAEILKSGFACTPELFEELLGQMMTRHYEDGEVPMPLMSEHVRVALYADPEVGFRKWKALFQIAVGCAKGKLEVAYVTARRAFALNEATRVALRQMPNNVTAGYQPGEIVQTSVGLLRIVSQFDCGGIEVEAIDALAAYERALEPATVAPDAPPKPDFFGQGRTLESPFDVGALT